MDLVTISYFIGEIDIPNTDQVAISSLVTVFINKYQKEFLYKVLGYSNAEAFIADYGGVTPSQKWIDLATGKTYTRYSKQVRWEGLFRTNPPQSPIANYIYYWYTLNSFTTTMGVGETKATSENSLIASAEFKMVRAWGEMQGWVRELYNFLESNKEVYTDIPTRCEVMGSFGNVNVFGI